MQRAFRLSELSGLSLEQISVKADEMLAAAAQPPNGELKMLDKRIQKFEHLFGCSSEEMKRSLQEGRQQESREICEWLGLVSLRNDLAELSPRSH